MKKWLSILTVGMLSSTVIPNINIVKNDNLNEKLMINNDNQYNPTFKKVKGFRGMASKLVYDSNNNLYFVANDNQVKNKDCVYKVNTDTTNAIEITGYKNIISTIDNLYLDKKDNLYIQTLNSTINKRELFILKNGSTTAVEITGFKNDGNFFSIFVFYKK